jgi:hypothetical protein
MPLKNKDRIENSKLKNIISGYAANKVIDWVFKNKVDHGAFEEFNWSLEDKRILKDILLDPKLAQTDAVFEDPKFKIFLKSVIDKGLNTDDVRLFTRYKNKLPLRALGLAYELSDFKNSAKGLISNHKIESGFYMLEISISPKSYSSHLPIVLSEIHQSSSTSENFILSAQAEKITKRLIKLNSDTNLRLESEKSWHHKDIDHFKLIKLTRNFFLSRLYKKLGKEFDYSKDSSISDAQLDILWSQYDQIFVKRINFLNSDYHSAVIQHEKETLPSASEQMRNLIRSLLK